MEKMYCGNCQTELPAAARNCPQCGILLAGIKPLTEKEVQALQKPKANPATPTPQIEILPGNEVDVIYQADLKKLDKNFQKCLQAATKGQDSGIDKTFAKLEEKFEEESAALRQAIQTNTTQEPTAQRAEQKLFKLFDYFLFLHKTIPHKTKQFTLDHERILQDYLNHYEKDRDKAAIIIDIIQLAY